MSVPAAVRQEIKEWLWTEADRLDWSSLSSADKSKYYTNWTTSERIGGRLGQFMDPRKVRVYIKDTLLKSYASEVSADPARVFRVLGVAEGTEPTRVFAKPHGCVLADGRHIAWSKARDWKGTLMSLHERAFDKGTPHAVVLTELGTGFNLPSRQAMVEDAACKLGIENVIWLD